MDKHRIVAQDAITIREWFDTRGGIAIWSSLNLANPSASWTTPLRGPDGTPAGKPTWQAGNTPSRVLTDPADVLVIVPREVKRFRVGVRRGAQGLSLKVTDASTRKIRAAVDAAGAGAWYEFDYATQEAVVYVPDRMVPLSEYARDWN